MISPGQELQMGRKTSLLLLSKRTSLSFVLMFLALAIGMNKDLFGPKFASIISTGAFAVLLIAFVLFVFGFVISRLEYKNSTFTLEEFDVKIKKGVLNITEISLPYHHIRSVDITRTLAYRTFGVSKLTMITDSGDNSSSGGIKYGDVNPVFDPIDTDLGEEVREFLQRKLGVQITGRAPKMTV